MSYTVKVDHPHFPEGTVFNVGGLDRVPNGGSIEVDDEMERLFIMNQGRTIEDAFANDHAISVSGNSSLDDDERTSLLEAYAPPVTIEEDEFTTVVDLGEESGTERPAWMNNIQEDEDA